MKMSKGIYFTRGTCKVLPYIIVVFCVNLPTGLSTDICSCEEANLYNIIQITRVPESLPEGSLIKTLHIAGDAGIRLRSQHPSSISFDNTTQEFRVRQKFNITRTTPLLLDSITVICVVIATGQEIIYKVLMEIFDENNNAPIFTNLPYIFNISEATPQGSTILPEITAVDADPSDAGKLTYAIKPANVYSDYFNFTVTSNGKLTLIKELNYELAKQFNIIVQVKDNSYNESVLDIPQVQHVVQTTVLINVLPILGESLMAIKTSYSLTISDKDQNIVIDPSFNNSTDLEFSLMDDWNNDDGKYFKMVSKNLEVMSTLEKTKYTLAMKVKKSLKTLFVVSIIYINVLKPTKFLSPVTTLILAENVLNGTLVAQMNTINPKKETTFYFIDKSEEVEFFQIDSASGCITTRKDLRNIRFKKFNLTVNLKDSSTNTNDNALLTVTISTVVNSSPKFGQSFYEFQPSNFSWIGQVQASSSSPSISVTYRLLDNYKKFSIDGLGFISCSGCSDPKDSIFALVVVAEAETPYNRSDSALVLVHQQQSFQPNWMVAFIIAIVLAIIFLLALLLLIFISFKRADLNSQTINSKIDSPDHTPSNTPRKDPVLKSIQKKFFSARTQNTNALKHSPTEIRSVSSDVQQIETGSMRTLVRKESNISDSSVEGRSEVYYDLVGPTGRKSDRMDWTSSQDTINASNMTLTRPAVGTNGITLYY